MKAVLAFVAICCLAASIHASPLSITVPETKDLGPADYRLERFIRPENYKIDIVLDDFQVTEKFTVDSEIRFILSKDPAELVLDKKVIRIHYAQDFTQDKVALFDTAGNVITIASFTPPNVDTEIAVITLSEELEVAKEPYLLKFTGLTAALRKDMSGFYLSSYMVGDQKKYIATTQFQSTDARAAFPCFDEPFFKATFDISITRPDAYPTVLGNTGKDRADEPSGTTIKTTFEQTPVMSTYLVAFIVSSFEQSDDSEYAIFYPEGMGPSAQYASEKTPVVIQKLQEKLKINYVALGNAQLYQAAIPDFSAGAMENWGLATYRETALLWEATESTARNKQRVCSVIAHELAHMWFGNYVTMDWWSEAFLNEGMARYFEYHTTALVEEDFDMKNQFVMEQQMVIFNADAVSTALPLSSKVEDIFTPGQVESKFGSITYNKGGSVFRMIERAMTEDKFMTALNAYLTDYKQKTTVLADLLERFKQEGLVPEMEEWFTEGGFPVVTVTRSENDVLLSQKRFLLDDTPSTTNWNIPITFATKTQNPDYSNTVASHWMNKDGTQLRIVDGYKETEIFILNVQGSGYYRVNYETSILERINMQLRTAKYGGIPPLNRAILIDDLMNMARVGLQSYDMALDLTKYMVNEMDYYPWVSAFNSFAFLNKRLGSGALATLFKDYVTGLAKNFYESVKVGNIPAGAKHMEILRIVLALQWACELNVDGCVTPSRNLFAQFVAAGEAGENPIDPNLRSVVYCTAIRQSVKTEWEFLFGKFETSPSAAAKLTILTALGCTKDQTQVQAFLDMSLEDTVIRKQDAYSVFTSVVNGNPENLGTALKFLIDNFANIEEKYASMNALSNIFNVLADRFTTAAQVQSFEAFLTANEAALGNSVAVGRSAVATANANIAWTNKFQGTIESWLKREKGAAPTVTASVLVVAMAVFMTFFY